MTPTSDDIARAVQRVHARMRTDIFAAAREARLLAKRLPDHFDVLMLVAYTCMRLRDYTGATAALNAVLRVAPDHHVVRFNLGICANKVGNYGAALTHFAAAARQQPREHMPAALAGRTLHRVGRIDDAISTLSRLLKRVPVHAAARLWLVHAMRDAGLFEAADQQARLLSASLRDDPKSLAMLIGFIQEHDFHGWREVDDKGQLARLARASTVAGGPGLDQLPASFVMPDERRALADAEHQQPGLWIVKPTSLHNGHGIHLVNRSDDAPDEPGWVVQQYVRAPYLVEGRKFSLRLFLLLTSVEPLRIYLFKGGRVVFSVEPYDSTGDHLDRLPMHITHTTVYGDAVAAQFEETKRAVQHDNAEWSYARLAAYMRERGTDTERLWHVLRTLANDVVALLRERGIFAAQVKPRGRYAFLPKVLGLDVLIDDKLRAWLTEVETGPTLDGLFDGGGQDNPAFQNVAALAVVTGAGAQMQQLNEDTYAARLGALEAEQLGQFEPLNG